MDVTNQRIEKSDGWETPGRDSWNLKITSWFIITVYGRKA